MYMKGKAELLFSPEMIRIQPFQLLGQHSIRTVIPTAADPERYYSRDYCGIDVGQCSPEY